MFYGFTKRPSPSFPLDSPTHVALYAGGGYVITHGNEDGPEHVRYRYWSALDCFVTYDVA